MTTTPKPPATKVTVSAPSGAQVTIEASEPMAAVAAEAAQLLERAAKLADTEPPGPAIGFTAERRYAAQAQPSSMWRAPGPYPVQA